MQDNLNKADKIILNDLSKQSPDYKNCASCGDSFLIEIEDINFYKKFIVPLPTFCPSCRMIRRMSFRNVTKFYKRKCDATGKEIVSIYHPENKHIVYEKDYWWTDNWDPMDYGRDYDDSKSFFDQFEGLKLSVPQYSLINSDNENCDYVNYALGCKDCYMSFITYYGSENCYYGYWQYKCRDCIDCTYIENLELCYECFNLENCYQCFYVYEAKNCFNCYLSTNLRSCKNCISCSNLVNKEYHYKNEPVSKEKFEEILNNIKYNENDLENFENLRKNRVMKCLNQTNSENCLSDFVRDCKNCNYMMCAERSEDCKYSWGSDVKDTMDSIAGQGDNYYEVCRVGMGTSCKFCFDTVFSSFCEYCYSCYYSKDCFACIGLRHKQFCIFNKQYTEEEYRVLVEKIKMDMLEKKEYGEFFPSRISAFAYNETEANDYYPMERDLALSNGFSWSDYKSDIEFDGEFYEPFQDINFYKDENKARELCSSVLKCDKTGKPFKIIPQELKFYLRFSLPLPKESPYYRMSRKFPFLKQRKLIQRDCFNCGVRVYATYTLEDHEKVYCDKCYENLMS